MIFITLPRAFVLFAAIVAKASAFQYYIDWNTYQCVENCDNDPQCNGRKNFLWEDLFPSLIDCCTNGLSWKLEECMQQGTNDDKSVSPIQQRFFVDWTTYECVTECYGGDPCSNRKKNYWEHSYATQEECCAIALSWVALDECISKSPTKSPSTEESWGVMPAFVESESTTPSLYSSSYPSIHPSDLPSSHPSDLPSSNPSEHSYENQSSNPSERPSSHPSELPSQQPYINPSEHQSEHPSLEPSTSTSPSFSSYPSQVQFHAHFNLPTSEDLALNATIPVNITSTSSVRSHFRISSSGSSKTNTNANDPEAIDEDRIRVFEFILESNSNSARLFSSIDSLLATAAATLILFI